MTKTSITYNGKSLGSVLALELAIRRSIKNRTAEILEQTALDAAEEMRRLTPFRTGNAYSSWSVARNNKHPPYNSNAIGRMPVDQSGLSGIKTGSVTIKNSAPHIGALEFGRSAQAPAGMVRLTLAHIESIKKAAVGKTRG